MVGNRCCPQKGWDGGSWAGAAAEAGAAGSGVRHAGRGAEYLTCLFNEIRNAQTVP